MFKRTKTISSISDFIKKLKKDIENYNGPIWFRGQAKEEWKLEPSFSRLKNKLSEMDMINKFRQSATMLINPRPSSLLDWLFIMQHHGVPTRLLDWTESPLVALYFAVCEYEKNNGVLWGLLPYELNKNSGIRPESSFYIPSLEDDILKTYTPESLSSERKSELLPIATIMPRNSQRMQAQLGVFTINHRDNKPIEEIGDRKHIWKYVIKSTSKDEILKELKILGFGKFQLFPELSSIGEMIKGEN